MKTLKTLVAAAALLGLTGATQASLVSLGNGTVKDTNTNLIWLQNWNLNGLQDWSTQRDWALSLDFGGSSDWRLPEISEYATLFASYRNLTTVPQFNNVQSGIYWSGTEFSANMAWVFRSSDDLRGVLGKDRMRAAVAVRPGDVTASVPEPQTLALALLALGATVVARRRRPA